MERFLGARETLSLCIVSGNVEVDPSKYSRLVVTNKTEYVGEYHIIEEHVLPDGTKHGKYCEKKRKAGTVKEFAFAFKFGKLHGDYSAKLGDSVRIKGSFSKGKAVGEFECQDKGPSRYDSSVFFEDGMPKSIETNGKSGPFVFDMEAKTLECYNRKFSDVFTSDGEAEPPCLLNLRFSRIDMAFSNLAKLGKKLYGKDEQGIFYRIRIPIFCEIH
ncbi:hypothetical protein [Brazilian marseillevirus]|uniref:hypothetical protein n=1 Tax=Brazilian marseillevirus TaxID=1813599 RepID=UPI00078532C9|nr:hypothetical protein A3303_gp180 [Brazilian marseillevirus]AMQ10688.1 hypothetical protein [Brazilian marseillevirus]